MDRNHLEKLPLSHGEMRKADYEGSSVNLAPTSEPTELLRFSLLHVRFGRIPRLVRDLVWPPFRWILGLGWYSFNDIVVVASELMSWGDAPAFISAYGPLAVAVSACPLQFRVLGRLEQSAGVRQPSVGMSFRVWWCLCELETYLLCP